jgi:hypothetical protein
MKNIHDSSAKGGGGKRPRLQPRCRREHRGIRKSRGRDAAARDILRNECERPRESAGACCSERTQCCNKGHSKKRNQCKEPHLSAGFLFYTPKTVAQGAKTGNRFVCCCTICNVYANSALRTQIHANMMESVRFTHFYFLSEGSQKNKLIKYRLAERRIPL